MKKILLLLSFISVLGFSQDIEIMDLDVRNTTNTDDYFYYIDLNAGVDTTLYLITGEYIMPWTYTSSYGGTISPRNAARVSIGGSGDLSYAFKTYGSGYFTENLRASRVYLGATNYMTYSGNNLIFYDATNGSKTLTELIATASSYSYTNGIGLSGSSVQLGYPLTRHTEVNTGAYNLTLGNLSNNTFLAINATGAANLIGSSIAVSSTGSVSLTASSGFTMYYNATVDENIFRDLTGDNYGLQYYTDYGSSIRTDSNARSLIDYGLLVDFLEDSAYVVMEDTVSVIATKNDFVNFADTASIFGTKDTLYMDDQGPYNEDIYLFNYNGDLAIERTDGNHPGFSARETDVSGVYSSNNIVLSTVVLADTASGLLMMRTNNGINTFRIQDNIVTDSVGLRYSTRQTVTDDYILGLYNREIWKFGVDYQGAILQNQLTGSLTDGAPTDAEIDAVIGETPASAEAGYQCTIKDSDGTGLLYRIESDGTDWFYTIMTKAL